MIVAKVGAMHLVRHILVGVGSSARCLSLLASLVSTKAECLDLILHLLAKGGFSARHLFLLDDLDVESSCLSRLGVLGHAHLPSPSL